MKTIKIGLIILLNIVLLSWGGTMFYKNYKLNQARENLKSSASYTKLKNQLKFWSDTYSLPVPDLEFRFNHSNEGFYNPSSVSITVLTTMEEWENQEFLEALLAHEFGHHYISFRLHDLNAEDAELGADFIARDLVGLEKYTKALSKGLERPSDESHMSAEQRIEILNQYPDNHILEPN